MSAKLPEEASPEPEPSPQQSSSRWSQIEDRILKQAVARYGVSHWDDVAKMVWTRRSAEECRARWAELVPILYQGLARRESALEQRRTRSITVSAVASSASIPQQENDESSQTPPLPIQGRPGSKGELPLARVDGNAKFYTEPSSPSSPTPLTYMPESPSPPLSSASARNRRNTEPGQRPFRAESMSRGRREDRREWLAPHPLMPGRPRRTPTSSRDTSAFKSKDDTTSKSRD
ncbi:hypothetical protein F4813DRAFT_391742 [Daldinia decipiens]|uniref:uncharacterized protein n=1 Tax=Daldinia decipiens TaxID=326647 RepID=UPI0020C1DCC4|nr:uncharacterized protein F4813DRAFT_391742 [Daldinia decipiens]KAI1655320.1 hypothetical protein F4813DRAFT_391742 [Daldinia decipiens]